VVAVTAPRFHFLVACWLACLGCFLGGFVERRFALGRWRWRTGAYIAELMWRDDLREGLARFGIWPRPHVTGEARGASFPRIHILCLLGFRVISFF
jgi:hypothetical protein